MAPMAAIDSSLLNRFMKKLSSMAANGCQWGPEGSWLLVFASGPQRWLFTGLGGRGVVHHGVVGRRLAQELLRPGPQLYPHFSNHPLQVRSAIAIIK